MAQIEAGNSYTLLEDFKGMKKGQEVTVREISGGKVILTNGKSLSLKEANKVLGEA